MQRSEHFWNQGLQVSEAIRPCDEYEDRNIRLSEILLVFYVLIDCKEDIE